MPTFLSCDAEGRNVGSVVRFVNTPIGRAVMVGLGFAVFLVTFVFFPSGAPLFVGSALGLVLMLVPLGLGGPLRRDREAAPEPPGGSSRRGGAHRRR